MDRSGPCGPQGPQPPLVDQERSGPPWTTLRHFPDAYARDGGAADGKDGACTSRDRLEGMGEEVLD